MQSGEYHNMFLAEKNHWWFRAKRDIICRLLRRQLGQHLLAGERLSLLDFGCGTGALLEELQDSFQTEGVDISPEAIRFCHQRGLSQAKVLTAEWQVQERYDVIVSSDVIEHIAADVEALTRMWRALKPGGLLLVTVPAYQWLWSVHDQVLHHQRRYSATLLRAHGSAAGLEWSYLSYYNAWLFVPAAAVRLMQKLFGRQKQSADSNVPPPAWLNQLLYLIFRSEGHLLGRVRLPFGLSLIALAKK